MQMYVALVYSTAHYRHDAGTLSAAVALATVLAAVLAAAAHARDAIR